MISARDVADPFIGLTIGPVTQPEAKLRIERRFGEGGTAAAYFGRRFGPDGISPVVVKVSQSPTGTDSTWERFLPEPTVAARKC